MQHDAIVIGAGPAGLATSRELTRRGATHVVLERGDAIGHTWANLYDSLVLHTGKHLSALPGLAFPASTPLFPSRGDFLAYLHRYAAKFALPIRTSAGVRGVERLDGGWRVRVEGGAEVTARSVVVATGIVSNPIVPEIAGRESFSGRITHSVEYRRPHPYVGRGVLVVGAGNSAGEIAAELAAAGAAVTLSVRSGARIVPRQLLGVPIQYFAVALSVLPRGMQRSVSAAMSRVSQRARGPAVLPPPRAGRCSDIPLIGFNLVDAIRAGSIRVRGGVGELTAAGARFQEGGEDLFDDVILATGYRAALDALGTLVRRDDCGFAARHHRVVSRDHPGLYFVGHNYDMRGGLRNIAQDARLAAAAVVAARRSGSSEWLPPSGGR
jgi:hypothetical protein